MWIRRPNAIGEAATVLLDTEGLYDKENPDPDYDARMMTVTMLLSSSMIYNVISKLDSTTLQTLGFVTRLANLIKMHDNESSDEAGIGFFVCLFESLFVFSSLLMNRHFRSRNLQFVTTLDVCRARQFPQKRRWYQ